MKTRILKMACFGVVSVACITVITFAESPPPIPPNGPTGWYWTGDAVWPPLPPHVACWDNPNNWEFRGLYYPAWDYPQEPSDDVYLTRAEAYPLILYLTTEEIDSLDIHGHQTDPISNWLLTFESKDPGGNTLSCDHITFKAVDGPFFVTVADNATIRTVD